VRRVERRKKKMKKVMKKGRLERKRKQDFDSK
jgi:hypothetical protein